MSLPAADRLVADRYALKAPLGRGGMGVVWRAQDRVLGRQVAVKEVVFPPTMADGERRRQRMLAFQDGRAHEVLVSATAPPDRASSRLGALQTFIFVASAADRIYVDHGLTGTNRPFSPVGSSASRTARSTSR